MKKIAQSGDLHQTTDLYEMVIDLEDKFKQTGREGAAVPVAWGTARVLPHRILCHY